MSTKPTNGQLPDSHSYQTLIDGDKVGNDKVGNDKTTTGDIAGVAAVAGGSVTIHGDLHLGTNGLSKPTEPANGESPYLGLNYFTANDAHLFFGRDALISELIKQLNAYNQNGSRFLAVIGASGSGKSSLVRAGLVPALAQGGIDGSDRWAVHVITPKARPLESLALSLTDGSESVTAADTLMQDMAETSNSLHLYARRLMNSHPADTRLLLIVDQFEELFTLCKNRDVQQNFIDNLINAATTEGPTVVVLTLRADFYAQCAHFDNLRTALEKQQKYIGSMTQNELRQAIVKPAEATGWEIEDSLVDLILEDVDNEPGALPLLSHALQETWKRRSGYTLTVEGYFETGRVQGAIAKSADSTYNELTTKQQTIARNIFTRMAELGEGAEDTRRRVALTELQPIDGDMASVNAVLKTLADARLVTTHEAEAEVAHEALIREWPSLREWLDDNRAGLRIHRHLTKSAQDWDEFEKNQGELYRSVRLEQVKEWRADQHDDVLSALEQEFLDSSIAAVEEAAIREEKARQAELEQAHALAEAQSLRAGLQAKTTRRLATALLFTLIALAGGYLGIRSSSTQRLGFLANALVDTNADTALRLSAEAYRHQITTSVEVESSLLSSVQCCSQQIQGYLDGHNDRVWTVDFHPNGTLLASGSDDGTVRIWDVESRREIIEPLRQPEISATVFSVDFNSDGSYLVVGNGNGQVITYRTSDWSIEGEPMKAHTGHVHDVEFSPDGRLIASAGADNRVILWDSKTQTVHKRLHHNPNNNWIWDVEFTPDGHTVAFTGWDKKVHLWDVRLPISTTLDMELTKQGETSRVGTSLAFLQQEDELFMITGLTHERFLLWDMAAWQEKRLAPTFKKNNQNLLPDKRIWYYSGHTWGVAVNPQDKQTVAIASGGGAVSLRRFDFSEGVEQVSIDRLSNGLHGHTGGVLAVAFSPDGETIATGSQDNLISLWRANEDNSIVRHAADIRSLIVVDDTQTLMISSRNGQVSHWNKSEQDLKTAQLPTEEMGIWQSFHPNGKSMAASAPDEPAILIWDIETHHITKRLTSHQEEITSLQFSQNGQHIAVGHKDGKVIYWSVEAGQEVHTFQGRPGIITSLAFHPSKPILASGGCSILASETRSDCGLGEVRLWNLETGEQLGESIDNKSGLVRSIAFSPDGTKLAMGTDNKMLTIWSLIDGGGEIVSIPAHANSVRALAFSPNSKRLASGGVDEIIRLWDTETGWEIGRGFRDHDETIIDLVFDQESQFLYSASLDNSVVAHDLRPESWYSRACLLAGRSLTTAEQKRHLDGLTRFLNRTLYGNACSVKH